MATSILSTLVLSDRDRRFLGNHYNSIQGGMRSGKLTTPQTVVAEYYCQVTFFRMSSRMTAEACAARAKVPVEDLQKTLDSAVQILRREEARRKRAERLVERQRAEKRAALMASPHHRRLAIEKERRDAAAAVRRARDRATTLEDRIKRLEDQIHDLRQELAQVHREKDSAEKHEAEVLETTGAALRKLQEEERALYAPEPVSDRDRAPSGRDQLFTLINQDVENLDRLAVTEAMQHLILTALDAREQLMISLRFGLGDVDAKTLREAGAMIGVAPERARQIQNIALMKLRRAAQRLF